MNYSDEFEKAYYKMKEVRNTERNRIIKMIEKYKDWKPKRGGGHGIKHYGNKRMPEYNLGNWMYIEFEIPELNNWFCLDLQSFDTDPHSGNMHLLDQRISLYSSNENNSKTEFLIIPSYEDDKGQKKAFDLPLSDEKITMLLTFIDRYTAWYCKMPTFSKVDLFKY